MFSLFKKQDDCCNKKHLTTQSLEKDSAKGFINYEWTDGYKAVNRDMTAPYTGFKYEVGKEYTSNVIAKASYSGFHFCKSLSNIIAQFPVNTFKYRYFKVKAFYDPNEYFYTTVRREFDYTCCVHTSNIIILLEEVPFDEIREYMNGLSRDIIQSGEEYASINGNDDYRKFAIEKCVSMLNKRYVRYTENYARSVISMLFDLDKLSMDKIEYMIGLRDEGASTDNIMQIVNGFFND